MIEAAKAWGLPYVFIYEDVAGSGLLPSYAEGLGKITLGTELGSKSQFGPEMLKMASDGIHNLLVWARVISAEPIETGVSESEVVAGDDPRDYIMAPSSGILEPLREMGDVVTAGEVIALIHNPERIEAPPQEVRTETPGLIMSRRSNPLTAQGECIATLVRPR